MYLHRDRWQQHGGMYRPILNFNHPWIPSPASTLVPLDRTVGAPQRATCEKRRNNLKRKRRWRQLCRFVKDLLFDDPPRDEHKGPSSLDIRSPTPRISLADWKAWGYYARPRVRGVEVRNSPPGLITPSRVDPNQVFAALRSPRGREHPEFWVPGLRHPSLPPRPTRWTDPRPGQPLPFPWECQINPFLVHNLFGSSPLYWDIGQAHTGILYGEVEAAIPLSAADKAQPATWPFLTHMYINAVADDTAPQFPWPIMVHNPKGIKCQDVFDAIYANFQQHVGRQEHSSWSLLRQRLSGNAYHIRVPAEDRDVDGLRRIDYLGQRVMFRGLEPNPNREVSGWVMFVGYP